ncbi:hypothetical protein [Streptomyces sp. NBC_00154]|nr:hypothetical protein [Streptomyces sp. NBC_00154]MCX5317697.1 hypothetical protein [Streptomyces sp. NBC_00154]
MLAVDVGKWLQPEAANSADSTLTETVDRIMLETGLARLPAHDS